MNLTKLFEMQKELDAKIVREKGLDGQDLLPQKILALQVELGECANEWRGFKFWSNRQQPKTPERVKCRACEGHGVNMESRSKCPQCNAVGYQGTKYPLLEEYVDCLHFILSIGLELGVENPKLSYKICDEDTITDQFRVVFWTTTELMEKRYPQSWFNDLFTAFHALGEKLGFSWEEVVQAYYAKNEVNHQRQATGY